METAVTWPALRQGPDAQRRDWLGSAVLYAPLLGVTVLSKLAFKVSGTEILIGVPVILGVTLLGLVAGRLRPHPARLALYLGMAAVLCAEQALAVTTFSPSSLLLLLAVASTYAFERTSPEPEPGEHLRHFADLSFALCLLGLLQYAAQFVVGAKYAFPIEHFVPDKLLTHAYHSLNPLRFGSTTYKANGVFLLEPSFFSQLLAVAFVLEAAGQRRRMRLGCMCLGFVVAYSGTGLLMLAIGLGVLVVGQRRFDILGFLLVAAVGLIALRGPLGLDLFVERSTEFASTGSSGYVRYVGGVHLLDQYLWDDPKRWLFGLGAGMMMRTTPWPIYNVAETGWVKLLVEFGLVGSAAYFGFLYACIARVPQPLLLRVSLAVTTLLSGILDPWAHGLILSLLLWPHPDAEVRP